MRENNSRQRQQVYINEKIKAPKVLLIDENGDKVWIVSRDQALDRAQSLGLDLVQLAYNFETKVCTAKIADFGKYMYDKKKQEKDQKKKQQSSGLKQIKISYSIGEHDLALKVKKAQEFLQDGMIVKVTIRLKWRENRYTEKAKEKLHTVQEMLADFGRSQYPHPKQEKSWYSVTLSPLKK